MKMVEKIKNSRVSKLVYPDGSAVLRDYTPRGQLSAVRYDADNDGLNLQLAASFVYDNAGRETSRSHGNGLTTTRSYSRNDNLVTGIACTGIVGLTYAYDANKNRTAETDSILTDHSYAATYDDKDRLTEFEKSNYTPHDQTWTLSGEGDWTNTVLGGVSEDRTHNAAHEILTSGQNAVTHDDKGNITINANGQRYAWDYENLLASVDINGDLANDVTYIYDANSRRIAEIANGISTVFVYADWQCVEEYDATSTPVALRKFAFGAYLDEPLMMTSISGTAETLHFYHQNANFNVIALTDAAGTIADRVAYSSYGQIVMVTDGSTGNPWFFTGQRHDSDTGLDYYKGRYYDSSMGRFLSRDPIEDGWNLYQYVMSSTVDMLDPLGLASITIAQAVDAICTSLGKYQDKAKEKDKCAKICPEHMLAVFARESRLDPEAYPSKFTKNPPQAPDPTSLGDEKLRKSALGLGGVKGTTADEIGRMAKNRLDGYQPPADAKDQTGVDSYVYSAKTTQTKNAAGKTVTEYDNVEARKGRWDVQANSDMAVLNMIDRVSGNDTLENGIKTAGDGTKDYGKNIISAAGNIKTAAGCKGTCCTCDEMKAWAKNAGGVDGEAFKKIYNDAMGKGK